ncbi:MAG TPA: DUF2442 domain-containing protein [Gemmatimonadaceae bacterium]|nr:DUF2442 domain-containing protein [Gemmatimonadaceae bacterium]
MSTAAAGNSPRIRSIEVTDRRIIANLDDERTISVPIEWSWRLARATPEQRANYRLIGGEGAVGLTAGQRLKLPVTITYWLSD